MKKLFLTAALIAGLFITTQAQTKPKPKQKSVTDLTGKMVYVHPDTVYVLNPTDVLARLVSIKNIITVAMQPNDVTPNQRTQAMHIADSLFKVDLTWYNKIKAPKPAPAAVPTKK